MGRVLITDYIENPTVENTVLGNDLETSNNDDVEVLLVWHQKINEEYVSQFPNLKAVIRYGVGFDSIDLEFLKSKSIMFCNTPDYGVDEVSNTAVALTLDLVRGIGQYDILAKNSVGNSMEWQELRINNLRRLNELTVGVIGAGRIGSSYLQKMKGFTHNLAFYDPYLSEGYDKTLQATRYRSLEDLFEKSDIISIHCPLSDETRGLINYELIKPLGEKILINTARGPIVESTDVFERGLASGSLKGVGLDVLPEEPPQANDVFIKKWINGDYQGKVLINPHTAFYTQQAFDEMRYKAALNAKRVLNNENLLNRIV